MQLEGSKELRELMLRFSFPRPRVSPPSTPDPLPSVASDEGELGKMADLRYPSLYQINTRVWLTELSQERPRITRTLRGRASLALPCFHDVEIFLSLKGMIDRISIYGWNFIQSQVTTLRVWLQL